jgi:hypothetical protein
MRTGTPARRPLPALEPAIFRDLFVKPANTLLSPFSIKTDLTGNVKGFTRSRRVLKEPPAYVFFMFFVFFY